MSSGKKTYTMLKRNLGTALVSSGVSANILKTGAVIMSYAMCWISFMVGSYIILFVRMKQG